MNTLKIEIPDGFKIDSFDKETGVVSLIPVPKDIRERVKSVEDACTILEENDEDVIAYKQLLKLRLPEHIIGNQELVIIIKALNEGWMPDWSNGEWDKWFNWFDFNDRSSSSGRLSFDLSANRISTSNCGSRLCFKSSELAEYAAKQFFDIYKKVYTI